MNARKLKGEQNAKTVQIQKKGIDNWLSQAKQETALTQSIDWVKTSSAVAKFAVL